MENIKDKDINISGLLDKFVVQMDGRDIFALVQAAMASSNTLSGTSIVHCTGIHALARYLECSESQVFMLKRNGVFDGAIISRVGKKIIFDADKARAAAEKYKNEKKVK